MTDFPKVRAAIAKADVARSMPEGEERNRLSHYASVDWVYAFAAEVLPRALGDRWEPTRTVTDTLPSPFSPAEWAQLCGVVTLFRRIGSSRNLTLRTGALVGHPLPQDLEREEAQVLMDRLSAAGIWVWHRPDLSIMRAPRGLLLITRGKGSSKADRAGFSLMATARN